MSLLKGVPAGRLTRSSADVIRDGARARAARRRPRPWPGGALRAAAGDRHPVGHPGSFPPGGFLQATEDGEAALVAAGPGGGCRRGAIADLFAGLGTFALAVGATYAAEASRDAAAALKRAAPAIRSSIATSTGGRSTPRSSSAFDAVILDPPRAGAAEQVDGVAPSTVRRIAYVSCNPATFARDAETLTRGGYASRLGATGRPVPLVDPCRAGGLLQPMIPQSCRMRSARVNRQSEQAEGR